MVAKTEIAQEVIFKFTKPKKYLNRKVKHNSKYASRIYLPADWEGKEVMVILK